FVALVFRKVAVPDTYDRPIPVGCESDLHSARTWWHRAAALLSALPAPRKYHAAIVDHLHIASSRDIAAVELDPVDSTGARVQLRHLPLPANVLRRVGQQGEDGFRFGCHTDFTPDGTAFLDRHLRIPPYGASRR